MSLPPGLRILSVEDDRVNQMVIARVLKRFGCEISACSSSEDALTGLQQLHAVSGFEQFPHVILMDLNLPGINGIQATTTIRQIYAGYPVPIIMLTGECSQAAINECSAAGCNGFLTKPVNANDLPATIQQCLGC
jgi:CheY-like chemotaxis protein